MSDRRTFIKESSALAGGILLQPKFSNANIFTSDKELKIGLVGCGGRGTGAAMQALKANPGNRLVAIGDVFEEQTSNCLSRLQGLDEIKGQIQVSKDHQYVGFDAYQKVVRDVDVVLFATPPAFRPEHYEYAVAEGKHVFLEKPLACDGPGIKRILEANKTAKAKNLKVVVGLQNRYDPAHNEMVKKISKGAIGDVIHSTCYYMKGGYKLIPRATTNSELAFQIKNYHYFTWLWAGAPGGLQIHNADIVHWVKGAYPVSAQGLGGRAVLDGPDSGDVFDHFYIEYTYPDGTKMTSQIRNIDRNLSKNGSYFIGTKGTANIHEGIKTHSGKKIWQFDEKANPGDSLQIEHDQLFAAVLNDTPINNTEYGAYSSLTAIMGRMAAHTGQIVTLDDAMNSEPFFEEDLKDWSKAPVMPDANGIYDFPRPGKNLKL